jgi:hypothetical protein
MKINTNPLGSNVPDNKDRRPILKIYAGDSVSLDFRVVCPWDMEAPTPDNSIVVFALTDQRFDDNTIWEGTWDSGITTPFDDHNDLLLVTIPELVTAVLRRGSFTYALRISDKLGNHTRTLFEGSLLVEYAPGGPIHDIPYNN